MIDFLAYTMFDQVVHARIEFDGERLVDLLASTTAVAGADIRARSLSSSQVARQASGIISLADTAIVVATGPRGSDLKRIRTIVAPVTVYIGPFVVHGYLHAPDHEGHIYENPVAVAKGRSWFPMTEAVLEYAFRRQAVRERRDAVLVNQAQAKAVVLTGERAHEARWLASGRPIDWVAAGDQL